MSHIADLVYTYSMKFINSLKIIMTISFLIVPGKGLGQNNPRHLVDVMANGSRTFRVIVTTMLTPRLRLTWCLVLTTEIL